jgi:hypothetical protein
LRIEDEECALGQDPVDIVRVARLTTTIEEIAPSRRTLPPGAVARRTASSALVQGGNITATPVSGSRGRSPVLSAMAEPARMKARMSMMSRRQDQRRRGESAIDRGFLPKAYPDMAKPPLPSAA